MIAEKSGPEQAARRYIAGLDCLAQHLRLGGGEEFFLEQLRYSQALVRNYLLPCLQSSPPEHWHVAVVGGAAVGKSTVVNILLGRPVAETNPQAGYTRHPTAFCVAGLSFTQPLTVLRQVPGPVPGNTDEDIFDIRIVPASSDWPNQLVVWDNPDMTTIHAAKYICRLLEILGLADLVVYVASVQRYNDRVPSSYLRMLVDSGKPVIACLTRVPERESDSVRDHFFHEVLAKIAPSNPIPCVVIPEKSWRELADPQAMADYRQQLLGHIRDWLAQGLQLRRRIVQRGLRFLQELESRCSQLAAPQLKNLHDWQDLASKQRALIVERYRREFLERERLPIFDEAIVRLLELLELPGFGNYISAALKILQLPWHGLKMVWNHLAGSNVSPALQSERATILQAVETALGNLWCEVEHRRYADILWQELSEYLHPNSPFPEQLRSEAERLFADYERARRDYVESLAHGIYRDLEANPWILNALRATKLTVEMGAIGGILLTGGLHVWDLIWLPLATSLIQALTEYLGQQYVETRRAQAKQAQLAMLEASLLEPLWKSIVQCQPVRPWEGLKQTIDKLSGWRSEFSQALDVRLNPH